ncbi:ankyrin repeat domain-containing protein SOWAHD [Rattus rattus]|uniref:ankyrin repeat domain-containing protein SOWAHD n=1 Tax=Rattus rattus TaxID=10117 RepID=UPI0013F321AD|nr:ankyrin repeat domain-containing protein SOWAHD [Rattus rattus]
MAQALEDRNPLSEASDEPSESSAPSTPQIRSHSKDSRCLGRYKGQAVAASANLSRERIIPRALTVSGANGTRRRGALRELLGLQGAAPTGCLSEEHLEFAASGSRRSSGQGSGRVCLEPREHAWILAAAECRFEVLLEMLEVEPSLLMREDPITGYSVLHWLAKHGRHEELILLHDFARRRGLPFDVSAPGSGGLTPLHLAALQGHDMVIKVLVGALGADPSRRDYNGNRPCHYLRPDASLSLRELSGAEEWEIERDRELENANNNSSSTTTTTTGWLKRTSSVSRIKSVGINYKEASQSAKEKKAWGNQGGQGNGLLRQLFPFTQNR